jgi:hypothetical protein
MQRFVTIILLSITLFSCETSNKNNNDTNVEVLNPLPVNTPPVISNIDTIITDIYYERPLRENFTLGVTVSEWNMDLANQTKEGVFDKLNTVYLESQDYYITNALKAYIYQDKSNINSRYGTEITGLFIEQRVSNTSVEIFKRDNLTIEQPILFGLEKKVSIPISDYKGLINKIISENQLVHIAGYLPQLPVVFEITKEDFDDPVVNGLDKFSNAPTSKLSEQKSVNKALFQNDKIYVLIETTVSKRAFINRNSEYEVTSIEKPSSDYTFIVRFLSKRYKNISPIDYMNDEQKRRFNDSMNTTNIINQTLKN